MSLLFTCFNCSGRFDWQSELYWRSSSRDWIHWSSYGYKHHHSGTMLVTTGVQSTARVQNTHLFFSQHCSIRPLPNLPWCTTQQYEGLDCNFFPSDKQWSHKLCLWLVGQPSRCGIDVYINQSGLGMQGERANQKQGQAGHDKANANWLTEPKWPNTTN